MVRNLSTTRYLVRRQIPWGVWSLRSSRQVSIRPSVDTVWHSIASESLLVFMTTPTTPFPITSSLLHTASIILSPLMVFPTTPFIIYSLWIPPFQFLRLPPFLITTSVRSTWLLPPPTIHRPLQRPSRSMPSIMLRFDMLVRMQRMRYNTHTRSFLGQLAKRSPAIRTMTSSW
jgi:hypothetical protein